MAKQMRMIIDGDLDCGCNRYKLGFFHKLMVKAGYTHKEFAKASGLHSYSICHYARYGFSRKLQISTLMKIGGILDIAWHKLYENKLNEGYRLDMLTDLKDSLDKELNEVLHKLIVPGPNDDIVDLKLRRSVLESDIRELTIEIKELDSVDNFLKITKPIKE